MGTMQPKLVAIEKLKAHPRNPRLAFREDVIAGITAGLNGEMSPEYSLRVRPIEKGFFEIVSGHHRWQAGLRKGLKELPCWVREMSDDEAYMALVKDNAQGELSSIEKAIHCYGSVGEIKPGTRSGKLTAYAKEAGWALNLTGHLHQAGNVASATMDNSKRLELSAISYMSLVAIHSLPRDLWPDFVKVMLAKDWSVSSTQQAVAKAEEYLQDPVTDHEFLPEHQCALAVATGHKTPLQFRMLADAAQSVLDYLQEHAPEKTPEWVAWLEENAGFDAWDIGKLEAKSQEFMPRPVGPVLKFKTIKEFFTDAWTFISTVNAPNTEEQGGCGGYLAVLAGFSDAEKEELHGYLATHCESLQEWLDLHRET